MNQHDVDRDPVAPCGVRLHELRRHRSGELAHDEEARVGAHIRHCKLCELRLADLSLEAQRFAVDHDAAAESHRIVERLDEARSRASASTAAPVIASNIASVIASVIAMIQSLSLHRRRRSSTTLQREDSATWARLGSRWASLIVAPCLILVLASVILLQLSRVEDGGPPKEPWREGLSGLRAKGRPALEMYVNAPNGPERVADGSVLREGDQIQFEYLSSGYNFLYILSIDGQDTVVPLFPDTAGESIAVDPEGRHVLEGSVLLDNAKGPERFVGVFSSEPLSFERVSEIVRSPKREDSSPAKPVSERQGHSEGHGRGTNEDGNIDTTTILIVKE